MLRFDNRVVVVTGAGAGLGREYALLFASRGAKVVVNDLGGNFHGEGKSNHADVVVNEIKNMGGIAVADYNSVTEGEKIIDTALQNFGRVDVLINNAGILRDRSFARISDKDWDLIQDVHLKGSFVTTRAAWNVFKKQNYGKIIMTSSNSGVYGNFGQANYSAAKLGLIGLANTLAIEGAKYNIHCNVIVPTAASRMTEGILPEEIFNQFKPKLIAPVVFYLCHESNNENGTIIESAGGFATKIHMVRGNGSLIRKSFDEDVTPEYVQNAWPQITDMSTTKRMDSISDASAALIQTLERARDSSGSSGKSSTMTFNYRDIIMYALGIGASVKDAGELRYLYENHEDFGPFPTYFVLPGLMLSMTTDMVSSTIKHTTVDLSQILHGEQYLEVFEVPAEGTLTTYGKVIDVLDKKSGALVITESESFDANNNLVARNQSSTFIVGAGNFNGPTKPSDKVIGVVPNPTRKPDLSVEVKTDVDSAAIYRLSGDLNPLHIDANFSKIAGYKTPILHGLCSLGFSVRAVLKHYANNDASLFKAVKTRFTKPVIPGQTLRVDMWQNGNRIHFRSVVVETNAEVLSGAFVDLKSVVSLKMTAGKSLTSDAVFEAIKERVKADPAKAKAVNAVFLYKITENGKPAKEWTLDLKNGEVFVGAPTTKVDTTLTVADADMVDIALGKLNPQQAFMKGKLKITGNIMLTQKLVPLLKTEAKL